MILKMSANPGEMTANISNTDLAYLLDLLKLQQRTYRLSTV